MGSMLFYSGTWFHLFCGFILGALSVIFVMVASKINNQNHAVGKFIGVLFAYSSTITIISLLYFLSIQEGFINDWQHLWSPRLYDPAVKILDLGYVQGQSGNIYKYVEAEKTDELWEQVSTVIKNPEEIILSSPANCGIFPFLPILPQNIIDHKSACKRWGMGTSKIVYAIDEEGSVIYWQNDWGEMDLLGVLLYSIFGGLLSIGFGVITIFLLVSVAFLKKYFRKINQPNSIQL